MDTMPIADIDSDSEAIAGLKMRAKYVPTERLLDLRNRGLSYQQIGKLCGGLTKQAVQQRIALADYQQGEVRQFVRDRADFLAEMQYRILSTIDNEEIKRAPFGTKIVSMGILFDKERLERGQTTEIISYDDIRARQDALRSQRDQIADALRARGIDIESLRRPVIDVTTPAQDSIS